LRLFASFAGNLSLDLKVAGALHFQATHLLRESLRESTTNMEIVARRIR
jgi:hypothetical protein